MTHIAAEDLIGLFLAIAVAYSLAMLLYIAMQWRGLAGFAAICGILMAIIECPHFVPPDRLALRAVACFLSVDLLLRCVEALRHHVADQKMLPWREYWRFLVPFPLLLVVLRSKHRRLAGPTDLRLEWMRIIAGGGLGVAAIVIELLTHRSSVLEQYFFLDHAIKLCLFIALIESLAHCLVGIEHLMGFDTEPIVNRIYLAKTPAEFWTRYNRRVQLWLYLNVFVPSGGRRHAARGVMVVFLVSAVLHELAFGIATSEFTGYQAAFFLLQFPAVIVSGRMQIIAQRFGNLGVVVCRVLTILWFTFTSMLFFHGVEQIFPIMYVADPWLR